MQQTISYQIRLWYERQKAQGQMLKRYAIYPSLPLFFHDQLCVVFSLSSAFDNIAVANIVGLRHRTRNDRFITERHFFVEKCFEV